MDIDFTAMAVAMGATVNNKTVTEFMFPQGRSILLEELKDMETRAAVQRLTNFAFGTQQVLR